MTISSNRLFTVFIDFNFFVDRLYPDIPPPPYPGTEPSAPESEDPPPAYGWADDVTQGMLL